MKKVYEMPRVELKSFDAQDIITASSGPVSEAEFMENATVKVNGSYKKVNAVANWNDAWNSYLGI